MLCVLICLSRSESCLDAVALQVPVAGGRPNTDFLRSFDPAIITAAGTVRVQKTLQVPLSNGKTNVYAVGDIIEWDEEKQLAKTPAHVAVVAANILASINNKTDKPKEYGGFMGTCDALFPLQAS